jgi:diacylglycerol kinase family enzyme
VTDRLLVVTNASAGSAEEEAVDAALDVLRTGADVLVRACHDPDELDDIVAAREGRRIVVAGGDGSLHVLVRTLFRRGELGVDDPLGLLPLGTGNDFARALEVPLDPADAARIVLAGRTRALDLLVDDAGGVVVNAVHVGVGAEAARRAGDLKGALGPAAYAVGSVAAGVVERGWNLRVEVDGVALHDGEDLVLMAGAGNGRTVGGGSPLTPDAVPDDGLADVVVSLATGPLGRVGYGAALRKGEHVDRPDVLTARGRSVTVSGEEFPVNADGELSGPFSTRTWTVRPLAWALLVP